MARPTPLSGFPEWLPAGRIVEQHVLDVLRRTFELYGYAGIETRAVEPLDQLLRKGETSKEVYLLRRLQEDVEQASARGHREAEQGLGLHFDLTVPFARYVLEHAGHLTLPLQAAPDPEGVAWRTPAGRAVPGVLPGRHRRGRPGGAAVPLRGGDPARRGRGLRPAA